MAWELVVLSAKAPAKPDLEKERAEKAAALAARSENLWAKMRVAKSFVMLGSASKNAEEKNLFSPHCLRRAAIASLCCLHASALSIGIGATAVFCQRGGIEAALALAYHSPADVDVGVPDEATVVREAALGYRLKVRVMWHVCHTSAGPCLRRY